MGSIHGLLAIFLTVKYILEKKYEGLPVYQLPFNRLGVPRNKKSKKKWKDEKNLPCRR